MEVRCCCDTHLIGYIDGLFRKGITYRFQTRDGVVELECAEVFEQTIVSSEAERWSNVPLQSAMKRKIALKSRDYPIELLRQIHGFREAGAE